MTLFGCRFQFRPPDNKLQNFSSRTENLMFSIREGGVIYHVDRSIREVSTKYVKFIEP